MLRSLLVFFLLSVSSLGYSQTWEKTEPSELHNSVVKIEVLNSSGTCISQGTGTVIRKVKDHTDSKYYLGYIITAAHVVTDSSDLPLFSSNIRLVFRSGKSTKNASVKKIHPEYSKVPTQDCAVVYGLIPSDIKPIEISDEDLKPGDKVEFVGYGAGDFRHFSAVFSGTSANEGPQIYFTWSVQGDSGGPIFRNGKIVGVIYGGDIWIKEKYLGSEGYTVLITSPSKSASLKSIRDFVKSVQ
jgi:hypothetical protein